MAVKVKPTSAEVIARYEDPNRSPAILRNRFGRGTAILVTTSESTFDQDDPIWAVLTRLTVGGPTLKCDPDATDRYRIVLTKVGGKHVMHVIDRSAAGNQRSRGHSHRGPKPIPEPFAARDLRLSVLSERLGGVKQAHLVGSEEPLTLKQESGFVTFTVRPVPVASVVFQ
jgi:hypothetical protein